MLPDDVLLEIFDIYRTDSYTYPGIWKWDLLVQVCPRWRQIVFASPRRLYLQILCTQRTPVRKNISIWPALPIVIIYNPSGGAFTPNDEDNVIAALEHPDRVSEVNLDITGLQLRKIAMAMQKPFSALRRVEILSLDVNAPVLPAKFLGGSAPCLHTFSLHRIPFPSLPTLLLSASDLVALNLYKIPPSGYISPNAMVVCLATLPRLRRFHVGFQSATSRPDRVRPPPVTRTVLPALTYFYFRGASEYLEDLVARIDGPQLDQVNIKYLNQLVDFQVARVTEFIDRSLGPKLTLCTQAHVTFSSDEVSFTMYPPPRDQPDQGPTHVKTVILCKGMTWQVSHMAQVLRHFFAALSNTTHLRLDGTPENECQLEDMDEIEWLHFLRQFSNVRSLTVYSELIGQVAPTLNDITAETGADVMPSLDLICIDGNSKTSLEKYLSARRLSGRPVTLNG